ncbi:hypothetical protein [Actinomadura sp. GC306]|uniref:hypothetical protein n=1 Tax=Actinomadura sp. GC306 TaxID=2530367 RepID=UPI001A9D1EEC|nr:hypothetical protein [Actinomadura sp. GC306]
MSKRRPITVQAAAALEAAEGLAALGIGVVTGVETATGAAVDPASAIGVTVLALAGGLGMLACARGLVRAEQWSRAPTVLTQFFAIPVAWSLWQSDQLVFAVPLGLAAVLTLITVLSPPSTAWLFDEDEGEGDDEDEGEGDDEAAPAAKEPAAVRESPGEPRSLGRRLMDRLKEQPTRK